MWGRMMEIDFWDMECVKISTGKQLKLLEEK